MLSCGRHCHSLFFKVIGPIWTPTSNTGDFRISCNVLPFKFSDTWVSSFPLSLLNQGFLVQPGSRDVRIWQSPHAQWLRVSSDPIISPQLSLCSLTPWPNYLHNPNSWLLSGAGSLIFPPGKIWAPREALVSGPGWEMTRVLCLLQSGLPGETVRGGYHGAAGSPLCSLAFRAWELHQRASSFLIWVARREAVRGTWVLKGEPNNSVKSHIRGPATRGRGCAGGWIQWQERPPDCVKFAGLRLKDWSPSKCFTESWGPWSRQSFLQHDPNDTTIKDKGGTMEFIRI